MAARVHATMAAIRILRGQAQNGSVVRACDGFANKSGEPVFGQLSAEWLLADKPYVLPLCVLCTAAILEALSLRAAPVRTREMLGIETKLQPKEG